MLIKHLLGREVLDSRGNLVGRVSDVEIDMLSGIVKQVLIKSGLSRISMIKPDDIITAGDKIIIRHRKENISKVDTFHFLGIKRRILCNW